MISKRDSHSSALETMKTARTANGEVQTKEEATVYVRELGLFGTVKLLEDTPADVSLGKLRRSGVKFPLDQWSETTPHQKCQEDQLQHSELRTLRCPWSIDKFFNFIFAYFTHIGTARTHSSYTASRMKEKWEYAWHRKSTGRSVAWTSRNPKSK